MRRDGRQLFGPTKSKGHDLKEDSKLVKEHAKSKNYEKEKIK